MTPTPDDKLRDKPQAERLAALAAEWRRMSCSYGPIETGKQNYHNTSGSSDNSFAKAANELDAIIAEGVNSDADMEAFGVECTTGGMPDHVQVRLARIQRERQAKTDKEDGA